MSAVASEPVTRAELDAVRGLISQTPQFVAAGTMTVDQLLSVYPAAPSRRGKYARVSDYAGFVDRVLRCDYFADLDYYQWTPTLPEYGRSMPLTGSMSLFPLKSPTSLVLTGTIPLGVTRSVTLETLNGRPGETKEIKAGMTSLLGNLNIVGSGLGSAVSLLLGGYQKYVLDSSSGALAWIRMV